MRVFGAVAVAMVLAGCGTGPGSPTGPSVPPPSSGGASGVPFTLTLQTHGPGVAFRVSFNGQTYTANGQFPLQLAPGTYTLNGDFSPTGLNVPEGFFVGFMRTLSASQPAAGVRSGSVRSVLGPAISTTLCSVGYAIVQPSTTVQTFGLQFEVTNDVNTACQF